MPRHPTRSLRRHAALLTLAALSVAVMPAGVSARDRGDHDQAREAVMSGQILPLDKVLERLQREQGGQVLEIELESRDGAWVYEVKLLQPGGLLQRLEVDAATGEVTGTRTKARHKSHGEPR